MPRQIKTALLSVSDKTGLVDFAQFLASTGVTLISTGGTAKALREAGLEVKGVSEVTGFPEVLRGRVKTLHPHIHAGLLADTRREEDAAQLAELGLASIDLVAVNLYPFERTAAAHWQADAAGFEEVVENIDIGGPCLVRAAAKNHANVVVLTSPAQYASVQAQLEANESVDEATRRTLALAAYRHTAAYDAAIATWLEHQLAGQQQPEAEAEQPEWPEVFVRRFDKVAALRYGENPHQQAAYYAEMAPPQRASLATARQLHGSEVSYNNLLDCEAAMLLAGELAEPACAVIKHTNPCGAAVAEDATTAFERARDADPTSAFGGILALNRRVDQALAEAICAKGQFYECLVAPSVAEEALEVFKQGTGWVTRLRILAVGQPEAERLEPSRARTEAVLRGLEGGLLVQQPDTRLYAAEPAPKQVRWTNATAEAPPATLHEDLHLAWVVCKHVKSNAIVLAKQGVAIGVGAGQMSRVEATQIAVHRAQTIGGEQATVGSVLASDAFFPFPDSIDHAANAGVKAIIQPGGSKRDGDVIGACEKYKIPMVFTGMRHFRH